MVTMESPRGSRRLTEWQLVFWGIFTLAFVGIGADTIFRQKVQRRPGNPSPSASTDAVLRYELSTENGSQIIAACLKDLPEDMPVFVVFPEGTGTSLAGILHLQLSLPHPITEYRTLKKEDRNFETHLHAAKRGVVFFLKVTPPADLGETVQISPVWWFTKLKET